MQKIGMIYLLHGVQRLSRSTMLTAKGQKAAVWSNSSRDWVPCAHAIMIGQKSRMRKHPEMDEEGEEEASEKLARSLVK